MKNKHLEIYELMRKYLGSQKEYYFSVIIFSIFLSLISLAIPVSVQSLVNTVTFGVLLQPIIVLTFLLLFILGINVFLNAVLLKTLEFFQQHFFAKTSIEIVEKLLRSSTVKISSLNKNSLAHRYYDIMTVQKSMTVILSDGIFIALQLIVGMILISLYHPYFLIFDIILIVSLFLIWKFFGQAAIKTALHESHAKYEMGNWISEVSVLHTLFKRHSDFTHQKSHILAKEYLNARNKHFKFLFTQILSLFILYAILSSFVLGVGGFLVIAGELSMGQLVAAEIIVTLILTSLTKFGKILEKIYDLIAALDKISIFDSLGETQHNIQVSTQTELKKIIIDDPTGGESRFDFILEDKKNYIIKSNNKKLKNILISLFKGNIPISKGQFNIKTESQNNKSDLLLSETFYILEKPELMHASIEENIVFDLALRDDKRINSCINDIGLDNDIISLPTGLETIINSDGSPLSYKSALKIEVVRALIYKPQFIILTSVFKALSHEEKIKIIKALKAHGIGVIITCDLDIEIDLDFETIELGDN